MSAATTEVLNRVTPANDEIGRRYLRAALFSGASGLLSRLFLGVTPLVLARLLGLERYGVYALVMSLVGVVAGTSSLGQNAALQKFLPEYAINDPARGRAILIASVRIVAIVIAVVSSVLLLGSHSIARIVYRDPSLAGVFRFAILAIAATVLFNHFSSVVIGLHRIRTYGAATIVRSGAFLVFGALGAWIFGLYGALAGQVIAATLALLILIFDTHTTASDRLPGDQRIFPFGDVLREIMSFGIPALLAGVVVTFGTWWGSTVLVRHAGFQQLGLFGAAYSLMQVILLLPSSLSIPAVSYLSETRAARGEQAFNELVGNNLRLIWALTLPISVACALFSRSIMALAFGKAFAPAAPLACWMALTALVIAVNAQIGSAIASLGRMWQALLLNFGWLLVFLPLSFLWVKEKDAMGLAAAYCVSYLLFTVMVAAYSKLYHDVRFSDLSALSIVTLAVAIVAIFLTSIPDSLPFLAAKVAFLGLLVSVEWAWVLRDAERLRARGLFHRIGAEARLWVQAEQPE